ncbi:DUF4145 domain-containing protein [Bacillus thuringiensis]|uniref:DUF4145 domain-containing protein n=1 Tax=Bacillus thuringiensis TaxID=1428 RepID=UPI000BFBD34D|nr:DUF4145 domain-containing protein [Bacillus thuringiensis]PGY60317.1 hypothetical protein COE24_07565 [Bacillus thuringiensis]
MKKQSVEPEFLLEVFQCPNCKSKTKHMWYIVLDDNDDQPPLFMEARGFYKNRIQERNRSLLNSGEKNKVVPEEEKYLVFSSKEWHVDMSICTICSEYLIWKDNKIAYPNCHTIEDPHEDIPEGVKKLYNEARGIVNLSPRSACALLRLAIEKLLVEGLGCPEKNRLNDNIKLLQSEGKLSEPINMALNAVRLVGNSAVHAGKIELDDKPEYAYKLFGLLNYIVDDLISRPARAEAFMKTIQS